jgi:Trypsin-like peptidase domain
MSLRGLALAVSCTALVLMLIILKDVSAQSPAARAEQVVEQSKRAIVKIRINGTDTMGHNKKVEGTGFFVGSDSQRSYLLTAQHVVGSSEAQQSKNPDWKVDNGTVDRTIQIASLDEHNNLVPRNGEIHVLPTLPGIDIAVLMIDQGGYPTLSLGDPLSTKVRLYDVMLLAFQKDKQELTRPVPIGIGDVSGVDLKTNVPSRPGESGGPWIDIGSGKVLAVARMIENSTFGTSNEATVVTTIRPWWDSYVTGEVQPEFAGLDIIYFRRPSDGSTIKEVLTKQKIKWRPQEAKTPEQSNVITCASDRTIGVAKYLASSLLEAGVKIRGIAPQATPIENKVTIEFYSQYSNQPVLTNERLAQIHKCPAWSDILSSYIEVTNACSFGSLNIYLRYYHPTKEQWVATSKYGLGPRESWTVTDADGSAVGSGRPYVLIAALVTTGYGQYSGNGADLPPNNFQERPPVTSYGCPAVSRY